MSNFHENFKLKVVIHIVISKVRIFETESGKLVRSVSHNNQTGRWLTTFKAEWHPLRDDLFFVGSMNRPRQIDAFTNTGEVLPAIQVVITKIILQEVIHRVAWH